MIIQESMSRTWFKKRIYQDITSRKLSCVRLRAVHYWDVVILLQRITSL